MQGPLGLEMWILKCSSPIFSSLSQVRGSIFSLSEREVKDKECAASAVGVTETVLCRLPHDEEREGEESFLLLLKV